MEERREVERAERLDALFSGGIAIGEGAAAAAAEAVLEADREEAPGGFGYGARAGEGRRRRGEAAVAGRLRSRQQQVLWKCGGAHNAPVRRARAPVRRGQVLVNLRPEVAQDVLEARQDLRAAGGRGEEERGGTMRAPRSSDQRKLCTGDERQGSQAAEQQGVAQTARRGAASGVTREPAADNIPASPHRQEDSKREDDEHHQHEQHDDQRLVEGLPVGEALGLLALDAVVVAERPARLDALVASRARVPFAAAEAEPLLRGAVAGSRCRAVSCFQ